MHNFVNTSIDRCTAVYIQALNRIKVNMSVYYTNQNNENSEN